MKFYVRSNLSDIDYKNTNSIYLIKDSWDDWFTYNTMYSLQYITRTGDRTSVGRLKIGEHPMKDGQRSANIPSEFSILPDNFFSVGQSASYYENLNLFVPSKTKIEILTSLNDIAYETTYLDKFIDTPVLRDSLLRDIPIKTVRNQFYRIITGGAKLTSYNFSYKSGYKYDKDESMLLRFEVNPESNPPTNIHIIIGRNNVGKTHLIRSMIHKIIDKNSNDEQDGVFDMYIASEKLTELKFNF